jgi:GTP diphosphokinase / guanosine-3',5'-bis(diphosphate) 3'-diphosphatase
MADIFERSEMSQREGMTALILRAALFAAGKHASQRRKGEDACPYINHPIAIAHLLASAGVDDAETLCAALLHDTLEDTQTTSEELSREFGERVTRIVAEVSEDKSLPRDARKQLQIDCASKLSIEAKLVKLGDLINNLADTLVSPPRGWSRHEILQYFDWSAAVAQGLRGTNAFLERAFDEVFSRRKDIV